MLNLNTSEDLDSFKTLYIHVRITSCTFSVHDSCRQGQLLNISTGTVIHRLWYVYITGTINTLQCTEHGPEHVTAAGCNLLQRRSLKKTRTNE